ncbi:MAG: hypothetical protein ACHQD8_03300 [Chitinophagales bacterium]
MIKRKLVFVLMLIILATSIAEPADAQFWKKKAERMHRQHGQNTGRNNTLGDNKPLSRREVRNLRKEQKKKEKQERKKLKRDRKKLKRDCRKQKHINTAKVEMESANAPVVSVKKAEDGYPLTKMKDRYRVDILAPMYLDELVNGESVTFKNKIPEKAEPGLAFYEGILIAADSLKNAGFNIDIYMHDIVSATETPEKLIAQKKLDSADLVIGAVQPHDIQILAAYAKKKQVNFISAASSGDGGVKNNAYFTLMQPSLKSHCEWIAGNVAIKFPGMNIALLYRTSVQADENAYKYMTGDNIYHVHYRELLCNSLPGKERLDELFDTTKPNIVIVSILDPGYADSLLTILSRDFPSTHFEVYGMPSWNSINDLRKEDMFPNLSVNVTTPFHVGLSSAVAKYVTRTYKKDYNGKVPEMVYRGYETMFWYANLLKRYGTIFNVKYEDNTTAPFTSFEIKPRLDKNGNILYYENKHVFLSKYEGGIYKTE